MSATVRALNPISKFNPLRQIAFFLLVLSVPSLAAGQTDSFGEPLKKKVVNFGPDPTTGLSVRTKLSCYFFPTFVVKEYDSGQKGPESASCRGRL
jgi:hypothetical protein